ncbi:hypothetical protein NW754_000968 [Fusarium falciforme]|uniref:Murein transglycosylase n=1 Tax=Fusarium falciforme TaxID=195108 RepID=A0A9W8R6X0_9HYPO|nr:hypothetical protein NW754_000968 [Fusarium falciforme]KAJ4189748.1 hypothetical protein NW755_005749 [Fusarium falciforme]KAJ4256415.1 hypothetical protein NW757_004047 [Fusarium falciforme]
MRLATLPIALAGILSASPSFVAAKAHQHHERGAGHLHGSPAPIVKRGGQCQFPTDDPNMVAVTPDEKNAGWAMSPDQECKPGSYCPFACKPGMVMNQWDPDSTYDYPASMNGGLFCNKNGEIEKPFEGKPNCVQGTGAVEAVNKCGSKMSWCQTVLPGNEAMIIPTLVTSSATLAVPGSSYWCSTAAHFYINPPGVGEEGCIWGTEDEPIGNWSPYVAGANTEASGTTFVKLGWNPIWEDSALKSKLPDFGVEIKCPDGGCNGLPCKIDPSDGEGKVESNEGGIGAGNSAFCVVTVPKGSTAQIVAFSVGSGSGSNDSDSDDGEMGIKKVEESSTTEKAKPSTTTVAETTTSEKTTSTTEEATSTTEESTTTSEAPTTSSEETTSTTSIESTTTTSEESTTTEESTTSTPTTATSKVHKSTKAVTTTKVVTTKKTAPTVKPGIFHENGTTTFTGAQVTEKPAATEAGSEAAPTQSKEGEAGRHQGNAAVAGLVVAFIAAACFF